MSLRAAFRTACVLVLAASLGCGTEPKPDPGPIVQLPPNNTPQNAVLRLVAAYDQRRPLEFAALLSRDFTFEFSVATDPALAQKYANGWFAVDESLAAAHLFLGGVNRDGRLVQAASKVELTFANTSPVDDNTEGRDPATHKVLLTRVDGRIVFRPLSNQTEPTSYLIDNATHRFFLVRGDAAQGLGARQPADSTHWYVWRWLDETASPFAVPGAEPQPTHPVTWGSVKAQYR